MQFLICSDYIWKMRNLMIASVLILMCCSVQAQETQTNNSTMGTVTGKVKFSPTRPGPVRANEPEADPSVLQKIYAAHKVRVLAEDGKKVIREVEINSQGIYKTELEPGIYFLQITPPSMGKFQKEGERVEVVAGKTIQADISVDTGIR
jgi:hypothetical protein